MYAVIVNVKIVPGQFEQSRKALNEEVVPRVKKAPGFVKGYWTVAADSTQGTSMAVFRTQQDAQGAEAMVRNSPPPPGVTLSSVEIREVVADA